MKGTSSSGSRIGNVFKSMKNQCHGKNLDLSLFSITNFIILMSLLMSLLQMSLLLTLLLIS